MSENTPSPSGGAVPPKPAEASKVQPKQATVRIALPPKPAGGGATIRLPTAAPAAPAPASAGATVRLPTAAPASSTAPAAPKPPAPSAAPATVAKPSVAPVKTAAPAAPAAPTKAARPAAAATVSGLDKALGVVAMVAALAAVGVIAYLVWGLPHTL